MKQKLLLFAVLLMACGVSAQNFTAITPQGQYLDFSVNSWDTTTVTWTGGGDNKLSDTLIIPETVSYNGHNYTVIRTMDYPAGNCYTGDFKTIVLPRTIRKIGYLTFCTNRNLTSVIWPADYVDTIEGFAFGQSSIESITLPNTLRLIGDVAFSYCDGLGTVEVPSNPDLVIAPRGLIAPFYGVKNVYYVGPLTGAPWGANHLSSYKEDGLYYSDSTKTVLYGCDHNMYSVTIPSTVTTIASYAFYNCRNLWQVAIPSSVTSIENNAFRGCTRLSSISVPDSVSSIGENAFHNIDYVNYSGTATGRPWGALSTNEDNVCYSDNVYFSDCTKREIVGGNFVMGGVVIPESVESVRAGAFESSELRWIYYHAANCTTALGLSHPENIVGIYFNDSVQSIPSNCFNGYKKLSNLTLPNSITSIGSNAFANCTGLTTLVIPDSVTTIGENAFLNIKNIVYHGNATGAPWGALCMNGYIEGDYLYSDSTKRYLSVCMNKSVTSTNIPATVDSIGPDAFKDCRSLETVVIPTGVKYIGNGAFSNCPFMTSVTFNARHCSSGGFSGCYSITNLTIGDSVEVIPNEAFKGCSRIGEITIPSIIDTIGNNAFVDCTGLTVVNYNADSCGYMGEWSYDTYYGRGTARNSAFSGCPKITTINFGTNVRSIPKTAFSGCSLLTNVILPDSLVSVGAGAFTGCENLQGIVLPQSLQTIGECAFENCRKLHEVIIPEQMTSIGQKAFAGDTSLVRIIFNAIDCDAHISWMKEDFCFLGDTNVTEVVIGSNVTKIPRMMFRDMKLSTIEIPQSVVSIGDIAFSNNRLTEITIPAAVMAVGDGTFENNRPLHTINYNADSIDVPSGGAVPFFRGCDSVKNVNIGNNVRHIPYRMFADLNRVNSIAIPNVVSTIDYNAFRGVHHISYYGNATGAPWGAMSMNGYTEDSLIYENESKTAIIGCHIDLTVANLPATVVSIRQNAFANCVYLREVSLPNSIHTIENNAFSGCQELQEVVLPESLTYIGAGSFANCTELAQINIPRNTSTIGGEAFINNTNLRVVLYDADSCTIYTPSYNSGCPFYHCGNLRKVVVGEYVKNIPQDMFVLFCYHGIDSLLVKTNVPPSIQGTFDYNPTLTIVNCGKSSLYQGTPIWNELPNIQDSCLAGTIIVFSSDSSRGFVNGGGTYSGGDTATISSTPLHGYRFSHWSDGATDNPYNVVVDGDSTLTAYFAADTFTVAVASNDTVMGTVAGGGPYLYGDSATLTATATPRYFFVRWGDNSTDNPRTVVVTRDTLFSAYFAQTIVDTVIEHDTTYIDVHDTTYIDVHDTTYVDVFVHDTTYINVPYPVHDTTYVNVPYPVHDTTYINVPYPVHDTTYVNVPVHDTTIVTDTLWLTLYDTVWLHDTVIIHDTIYITQEGIDGTEALNVKVYASNGQIVVEGAEGNDVTLYDVNGRMMAVKRDEHAPQRFDAPASGTYMIKIGNWPARKVVVIR